MYRAFAFAFWACQPFIFSSFLEETKSHVLTSLLTKCTNQKSISSCSPSSFSGSINNKDPLAVTHKISNYIVIIIIIVERKWRRQSDSSSWTQALRSLPLDWEPGRLNLVLLPMLSLLPFRYNSFFLFLVIFSQRFWENNYFADEIYYLMLRSLFIKYI